MMLSEWRGRRIQDMSIDELKTALSEAVGLLDDALKSVSGGFVRWDPAREVRPPKKTPDPL